MLKVSSISETDDFKNREYTHKRMYPTENTIILDNKSVLVALELPNQRRWRTLESLEELKALAESANLLVDRHFINKRTEPSAPFFIGSGTIEKIKIYCDVNGINNVLFDEELSPAQKKNIVKKLGEIRVFDRTEIILDIFAQRARSKEGKLQIELAQLEYLLPRLTRQWIHLMHQEGSTAVGAVGVRGPGEKQLEMDRRQVRDRINAIKKELKVVENYRAVQRKQRQRKKIPVIGIIGYTNAGKSTLMNKLTSANVLVENKLFATLDPTTRRFSLPNNQDVLFVDTVGFINKLPHQLVDAFKATLEEVIQSDFLIHILDVSDDKAEDRSKTVYQVLEEIGVKNKTIITVLNKIDLLPDNAALEGMINRFEPCVAISAKNGKGFNELFDMIIKYTENLRNSGKLLIPVNCQKLISKLYENGDILVRKDYDYGVYFEAEYDISIKNELKPYIIES